MSILKRISRITKREFTKFSNFYLRNLDFTHFVGYTTGVNIAAMHLFNKHNEYIKYPYHTRYMSKSYMLLTMIEGVVSGFLIGTLWPLAFILFPLYYLQDK